MAHYFADRVALLDEGSHEFLTRLVALGGYCTVAQTESLNLTTNTRVRRRLRFLERLGFLRKVAAYPVVYQATTSTARLLGRDSGTRRKHVLETVQTRLLGVDFYLEARGWPAEFILNHEQKIATFTDSGFPIHRLPQRGDEPYLRELFILWLPDGHLGAAMVDQPQPSAFSQLLRQFVTQFLPALGRVPGELQLLVVTGRHDRLRLYGRLLHHRRIQKLNELRRRGLSRKTILNALSAMASMLRAARDWDYLAAELDWKKLRLPVEELQKPQRYFTPDESQRIIDAAPEPWNICFAFMAYLGLRTSEAVGIAWEHIDLDARVLRVRQSNWRGKLLTVKSKASVRDLPLPPVLIEMLKDYRRRWRLNPLGLLFANAKGRPITSCYLRRDILHPIRERLGIARGGFHAFRHGLGTELMRVSANPRVVQEQLGHADLRMLQRYAHVVPEDRRSAIEGATEIFLRRSAANSNGKLLTIN